MNECSIRQLLSSGVLGPVRLGATRGEVLAGFGEPDCYDERGRGCGIWRYGDLELNFTRPAVAPCAPKVLRAVGKAVLTSFNMHAFDDTPTLTGKRGRRGTPRERSIALDPWFIKAGVALEYCEQELSAAGFTTRREDALGTPWAERGTTGHERMALHGSQLYLTVRSQSVTATSTGAVPSIRIQFLIDAEDGDWPMGLHGVWVAPSLAVPQCSPQ